VGSFLKFVLTPIIHPRREYITLGPNIDIMSTICQKITEIRGFKRRYHINHVRSARGLLLISRLNNARRFGGV